MIKSHDSVSEIIIENSCYGVGVGETFNVKRMNDLNKYFFYISMANIAQLPILQVQNNTAEYH